MSPARAARRCAREQELTRGPDDRTADRNHASAADDRWARLREQVDAHRVTIVAACSMLLVAATVAPILMTPYRSDDARLQRGPAPGVSFWDTVLGSTHEWMTTQGRFFPGAAVWSNGVFALTGDRLAYKATLAALSAVLVVLAAWFAVTLTRRGWAGPVTVVALASTMTLRVRLLRRSGHVRGSRALDDLSDARDPLLLVRRRGWVSALVAALLWSVALMTYEVVIALLPTVVLVVWMTTRSRWRALAVAWPTFVDVAVVFWLRAHATSVSVNYSTSFDGAAVWRTYLRQAAGGAPDVPVVVPRAEPPAPAAAARRADPDLRRGPRARRALGRRPSAPGCARQVPRPASAWSVPRCGCSRPCSSRSRCTGSVTWRSATGTSPWSGDTWGSRCWSSPGGSPSSGGGRCNPARPAP